MIHRDWTCPQCKEVNFEKRDKCRKCGCFRSKALYGAISASTSSSSSSSGTRLSFKPGDWFCDSCATLNFAKRPACYKCSAERPPLPVVSNEGNATKALPEQENKKCSICMENEPDTVFTKCGHLVCCGQCAASLNKCPMCRVRFLPDRSDVLKVFTP